MKNYKKVNDIYEKIYNQFDYLLAQGGSLEKYNINSNIFGVFHIPFLNLADRLLRSSLLQNSWKWNKELINSFFQFIYDDIEKISIRVLIYEMHLYKSNNTLSGKDGKEKYEEYLRILQNITYVETILNKYPALKKQLIIRTYDVSIFLLDIYEKFMKDRNALLHKMDIGLDFELIKFVKSNGDVHFMGQRVCILELSKHKKIVYKPRDVTTDIIFYKLLNFVEKNLNMQQCKLDIVNRDEYAWIKYVVRDNAKTFGDVKKYYFRLGIELCIAYILGIRDLHCENVIVHKTMPFFIDLENAFVYNQNKNISSRAETVAYGRLSTSVLNSGILPPLMEKTKGIENDFSLLGFQGQKIILDKSLTIINPRTSDMRVSYISNFYIKPKCIPDVDGIDLDTSIGYYHLLKGFRNSYILLLKNKWYLENILDLIRKVEFKSRYLVNDTQIYSMLLQSSYHPKLLMNENERYRYIKNILSNKCDVEKNIICNMETDAILRGEIPYFYKISSKKNLYDLYGNSVKNFSPQTVLNEFKTKVESMSEEDLKYQESFIKESLQICRNQYNVRHVLYKNIEYFKDDTKTIKNILHKIAELISTSAIFNYDKKDVSWIIKTPGNSWKKIVIKPCDYYIYNGIAGFAILYFSLTYSKIKWMQYHHFCEVLESKLFRYTTRFSELLPHNRTGLFNGESSIVYCYQLLFKITNNTKYLKYADIHLNAVLKIMRYDSNSDWLSGKTGVLIVLMNMYNLTRKIKYINKIDMVVDLIIENAIQCKHGIGWKFNNLLEPLTGIAHGNSGIIIALARATNIVPNMDKCFKSIKEALLYENKNINNSKEQGNWEDLEGIKHLSNTGEKIGWCNGTAGIMFSRMELLKLCDIDIRKRAQEDLKEAYDKILNSEVQLDLCLCHGYIGVEEVLGSYANFKKISTLGLNIIQNQIKMESNCKCQLGFMDGYSGIAYYLLSCLDKELPSILLGEI